MSAAPAAEVLHQIGDVADVVGLSVRTIRHWEAEGLVSPRRTASGLRLYTADEMERLLVLKQMKPLGLSLAEMGKLVALLDAAQERSLDRAGRERLADFGRLADEAVVKHGLYVEQAQRLSEQIAGAVGEG